ncbi:MAG: hypothetical protein HW375_7 [Anaerolineales bacterium]|nr:hypothetical protein [Anaerolineales bacterium]
MPKGHWSRTPERAWTSEQLHKLEDLLGLGLGDEEIGRRLGRSAIAVNSTRKRRGLPSRRRSYNTCRNVAGRLGMGCSKTVAKWIKRGWLRARAGQRVGMYHDWVISEDALLAFLEDPRYWMAWDVAKVTDSLLGVWVRELRTERWLSVGEVCERYFVSYQAVNTWIRRKHVRASRWGNWWIRDSDLEGFVAPCNRPRPGQSHRRFTPDELRELVRLKDEGKTLQQIADRMGRNVGSIYGAWRRYFADQPVAEAG